MDVFLHFFIQPEKEFHFNSFFFSEGYETLRMKAIRDLLAEIVDANHMAGKKAATVFGEEKAAGRFHSFSWQANSQQQIDQKQGFTVIGFEAGAAAGPALVFITLPA
jgi:hypothetical protein